jgi:hypothetical protein
VDWGEFGGLGGLTRNLGLRWKSIFSVPLESRGLGTMPLRHGNGMAGSDFGEI